MAAIASALSSKEKEAKELMKKAKSLTGPSLLELRFKPDWESAAPLLDKAALLYKQAGNLPKALEAYDRAAMAQERMGSQWHAAKHYEVSADLCMKMDRLQDCAKYYKMAADLYMECGKPTAAGEVLTRGARALEEPLPEDALKLYYDALDVYESGEKESYGVDCYRAAAAFLVRGERWADAVEVQMRFGAVCDRLGTRHSQMKAYLGAVVTWLYAGDAEKAWHTFQDAMAVDAFATSEEAYAADALFEAYRSGDEPAVKAAVKAKSQFRQLDHAVGRLAQQLPAGGRLRRMARKLGHLMAQSEEEEEAEQEEEQEGEEAGGEEEGMEGEVERRDRERERRERREARERGVRRREEELL